ncbi:MAG: rhomboid family intramembrane serine protease [Pseudomonadota bacterium]
MFIPLHDANYLRHIRLQYVTIAIILVNCVIWVFYGTSLFSGDEYYRAAVYSYGFIPAVANGYQVLPAGFDVLPYFTHYVSYAFLHNDFWHLAGNMLFIWVFGDNVEDAMGHIRFIFFFLACAAAGALMHSVIHPESVTPLIGASGAAAGIITAYVMLHPSVKIWILALGRIPLRLSALWVIGAWIVFQIGNLIITGEDKVSWAAHVGGIIAGAALIPIMKRRNVPLFDRKPIDEVIPPAPAPDVAEDDYPLPGQPKENSPEIENKHRANIDPPSPWGRQPRRKD